MSEKAKKYRRGLKYVLGASCLGLLLHDTRPFSYLEEITFDAWVQSHQEKPDPVIELVTIGDEAYRTKFGSTSPLSPAIIATVIRKVYDGGAKVIGVDLDTSEWNLIQFGAALGGLDHPERVVWAVFKTLPPDTPDAYRPGYAAVAPASAHDVNDRNETGIIRSLPEESERTFAGQLQAAFKGNDPLNKQNYLASGRRLEKAKHEGAYFRFVHRAGEGATPAFAFVPMEKLPPKEEDLPKSWKNFFEGKAVLIGGTAEALRDFHDTPFGPESGLGIQAEQLQSLLDKRGPLTPINEYITLAVDFLVGAAFLGLTVLFPRKTGWFLVGALPVLAWLSFRAFVASWVFTSFIAVFLGLLLHSFMELYSDSKEIEGR